MLIMTTLTLIWIFVTTLVVAHGTPVSIHRGTDHADLDTAAAAAGAAHHRSGSIVDTWNEHAAATELHYDADVDENDKDDAVVPKISRAWGLFADDDEQQAVPVVMDRDTLNLPVPPGPAVMTDPTTEGTSIVDHDVFNYYDGESLGDSNDEEEVDSSTSRLPHIHLIRVPQFPALRGRTPYHRASRWRQVETYLPPVAPSMRSASNSGSRAVNYLPLLITDSGAVDMQTVRQILRHLYKHLASAKRTHGYVHGSLRTATIYCMCRQNPTLPALDNERVAVQIQDCVVSPAAQLTLDRNICGSSVDTDVFDLFMNIDDRLHRAAAALEARGFSLLSEEDDDERRRSIYFKIGDRRMAHEYARLRARLAGVDGERRAVSVEQVFSSPLLRLHE